MRSTGNYTYQAGDNALRTVNLYQIAAAANREPAGWREAVSPRLPDPITLATYPQIATLTDGGNL